MTSQAAIITKNMTINISDRNGTGDNEKSYGGYKKIIRLKKNPPVSLMYN